MGHHCCGLTSFCECGCVDDFVPHEDDETLAALADEGATEILRAVHDEVYGDAAEGWRA